MAGPTVSTTFNAVDRMTSPMKRMQGNMSKFAAVVGSMFATGLVVRGIKSFVDEASKIEDAVAGFTPLMGGAEKANQLVDALNKTAASTPYQFEQIADAAKQLLPVMNGDIQNTVDTFRMLGDTAGGNAQKLDSVTRGFTKSMLKGKVDLESLNMISEAGVPIFAELSKSLGITTAQMFKMVSAGEITTDQLTQSFRKMTSEGGLFYKGMEIASKTLSGKMSTLKDNISLTKAAIGTALLPTIKPLIDKMIEAAGAVKAWADANQGLIQQRIESVLNGIKVVVDALVAGWNSGLIPAILAGVATFKVLTGVIAAYQSALAAAKAVQLLFNLAMMANPVGLIIAGISALIALLVIVVKYWDKIMSAMQAVGDFFNPFKDFPAQGAGLPDDPTGLISPNQGGIENRSFSESRTTSDVYFHNPPPGTAIKQSKHAPPIRLPNGFGGAEAYR